MLIICQIDWREVGVAFELQCLRNCTLSSFVCFQDVRMEDTGRYYCIAENDFGRVTINGFLLVRSKDFCGFINVAIELG